MIFTDTQLWGGSFAAQYNKYLATINPNVHLYIFDLSGYGTVFVPQNTKNVHIIGGWSDKVFDFIHATEKDAPIKAIKEIKPVDQKY